MHLSRIQELCREVHTGDCEETALESVIGAEHVSHCLPDVANRGGFIPAYVVM